MKRSTRALFILAIAALSAAGAASPRCARAQVFGGLTTAALAAEGEGGFFLLAGNDAFRAGALGRFAAGDWVDIGVQLGVERIGEASYWGGGADAKLSFIQESAYLSAQFPVSLALDGSAGFLGRSEIKRYLLGIGFIASGRVVSEGYRELEPYLSLTLLVEQIDFDGPAVDDCGFCPRDGGDTESDLVLRGGVKVPLTKETQAILELGIGDDTFFGAAFNIVF